MQQRLILTAHGQDRKGLVAAITSKIYESAGNIVDLDQHVDAISGRFFIRVQWELDAPAPRCEALTAELRQLVGGSLQLDCEVRSADERPRLAVFVSRQGHCLWDILARVESGEWAVDVPVIVSNHETLRPVAERFGIPYEVFPIDADNKLDQEARQLELLRTHQIETVILARYMQVLSPAFVAAYPQQIINIHHSFLPAFPGARPYQRAHERGVKIIGATAHYVTEDLDEGPIVEQDTARVGHGDAVEDLVRLGRDLEKIVLSRAIFLHIHRRVIVDGRRTIVFS